ncbi:MAG: hypothetical protein AAF400_01590 [Bacteroidota bacterium]
MSKLAIMLLSCCASFPTWAQGVKQLPYIEAMDTDQVSKLAPYISAVLDGRLSALTGAPKEMELRRWRCYTISEQIYYNIPTKVPYLTVSIGLGLVREAYTLQGPYKLKRDAEKRNTILKCCEFITEPIIAVPGVNENPTEQVQGGSNLTTSSTPAGADAAAPTVSLGLRVDNNLLPVDLEVNYVELGLPVFRLNTNRQAPESGFALTVGCLLGMRLGRATQRISYKEDNEWKKVTESEPFNFNDFRFGFMVRAGWERINIFYTQTLTGLFHKGMGPNGNKITPWSMGVSLSIL